MTARLVLVLQASVLMGFASGLQTLLMMNSNEENIEPVVTDIGGETEIVEEVENNPETLEAESIPETAVEEIEPEEVSTDPVQHFASVSGASKFFREVTNIITCPALEDLVLATCGPKPIGSAIPQFGGDVQKCVKVYDTNPHLKNLFSRFMIPLLDNGIADVAATEEAGAEAEGATAEEETALLFSGNSQEDNVDDAVENIDVQNDGGEDAAGHHHHLAVDCTTLVEGWRMVLRANIAEGGKYSSASECEYSVRMGQFNQHCSINTSESAATGQEQEEEAA